MFLTLRIYGHLIFHIIFFESQLLILEPKKNSLSVSCYALLLSDILLPYKNAQESLGPEFYISYVISRSFSSLHRGFTLMALFPCLRSLMSPAYFSTVEQKFIMYPGYESLARVPKKIEALIMPSPFFILHFKFSCLWRKQVP